MVKYISCEKCNNNGEISEVCRCDELPVDKIVSCENCKRLRLVLKIAKEKIEAYQDHFGVEYPGGAPINGLMNMINNELKIGN